MPSCHKGSSERVAGGEGRVVTGAAPPGGVFVTTDVGGVVAVGVIVIVDESVSIAVVVGVDVVVGVGVAVAVGVTVAVAVGVGVGDGVMVAGGRVGRMRVAVASFVGLRMIVGGTAVGGGLVGCGAGGLVGCGAGAWVGCGGLGVGGAVGLP